MLLACDPTHDSGNWLDTMRRKETLSWQNFSFVLCNYHVHYFHFGFLWISCTILFVFVKFNLIWFDLTFLFCQLKLEGVDVDEEQTISDISFLAEVICNTFKLIYSWLIINGMFID